jgi:hypothetical protein
MLVRQATKATLEGSAPALYSIIILGRPPFLQSPLKNNSNNNNKKKTYFLVAYIIAVQSSVSGPQDKPEILQGTKSLESN